MNEQPDATSVIRYLTTTTNHLINPNRSQYYYEYATGIKTGYTVTAANCIVASAKKDGVELIVVIFGASGWTNLRNDCVNLFEYGIAGTAIIEKTPVLKTVANAVKNVTLTILKLALWSGLAIILIFTFLILLKAYILTKRQRKRSRRRTLYNARFR